MDNTIDARKPPEQYEASLACAGANAATLACDSPIISFAGGKQLKSHDSSSPARPSLLRPFPTSSSPHPHLLHNSRLHLSNTPRAISQHRHPRKKHQLTFLPGAFSPQQSRASRMFVQSTVAVALLASLVSAQANLTFDPSTIDLTTRGLFPPSAIGLNASNVLLTRSMVPSRVQHLQSSLRLGQRKRMRPSKSFVFSMSTTTWYSVR